VTSAERASSAELVESTGDDMDTMTTRSTRDGQARPRYLDDDDDDKIRRQKVRYSQRRSRALKILGA